MSRLREAAQGVLDAYFADEQWLTPYWDALRDALTEEPKIGEQPPQHWDQLVANLMRYGMTKSTAKEVATGLMAMGWRRCAEGQKETQHCALLEAAVLAEREACARVVEEPWQGSPKEIAAAIRARGEA